MCVLRHKAEDIKRAKSPAERFTVWFFFFLADELFGYFGQEKILTLCFLQMGWSLSYKLTSWFINLLYNSQEGRSVRIWGAHWSKENSWAATYQVWTHRGHSRKHLLVSSHFTLLRARRKIRWLDGFTDSMDMSLSKLPEGRLACCSPWSGKESDTTLLCFGFTDWGFAVTLCWASLPAWKGQVAVSVIPNFLLLYPKT